MHDASHAALLTIAAAISAGIILIALARRVGVPAIVMLLVGGFVLGPEVLGIVQPESLGSGLRVLVPLMVGLILFEGGLTLELRGYRLASGVIRRLLSLGILTTWFGTATIIWLLSDHDFVFAVITASLVIVTGPTVIGPLLKRIHVNERLHHILHWEGVLIDPIGVFVALLCFEGLALGTGTEALLGFGLRSGLGLVLGFGGGWVMYQILRLRLIPEDMISIGVVGLAVLLFGATEYFVSEGGLLSVTCAGFVLGWKRPVELERLKLFKAELIDLCIGLLFILLTARLSVAQFEAFGSSGFLMVVGVMVLVRPLTVLVSTIRSDETTLRERIFLSWCAPRGIVAASMASLFAIELERLGHAEPRFVESFTYAVIVGTIFGQGLTAGLLARVLGVVRVKADGWLVVGAHALGQQLGRFLRDQASTQVLLVDTNPRQVREAQRFGLDALRADARDVAGLEERHPLAGIGNFLALTDNEDLNVVLCQRWSRVMGTEHVHRWQPGGDISDEAVAGQPVWRALPRPSVISAELYHGESRLHLVTADSPAQLPSRHLLSLASEGARLDPDSALVEGGRPAQGAKQALYLAREADFLTRSLRPELVLQLEGATTPEALLVQLMQRVAEQAPAVDPDAIVAELIARERSLPSSLGHGVAAPHGYIPGLARRFCAIAQLHEGVDWDAPDGEPVRLVFLILSPQGDHEGHLATLADVARLVMADDTREAMLAAETPDQILEQVQRGHGTS